MKETWPGKSTKQVVVATSSSVLGAVRKVIFKQCIEEIHVISDRLMNVRLWELMTPGVAPFLTPKACCKGLHNNAAYEI